MDFVVQLGLSVFRYTYCLYKQFSKLYDYAEERNCTFKLFGKFHTAILTDTCLEINLRQHTLEYAYLEDTLLRLDLKEKLLCRGVEYDFFNQAITYQHICPDNPHGMLRIKLIDTEEELFLYGDLLCFKKQ